MQLRKILVPVDFSLGSVQVVEHALQLAQAFGAGLELLHVWEIPGYVRPDLTVWVGDVSGSFAEHARRDATERMAELLDAHGLTDRDDVVTRLVCGTPYASILGALETEEFDLVVMGTHGRGGLSHALLGSVAERVVRHAPCPVLTVRTGKSGAS
jgi:nucleotide-binding universal stress UspA family protein